MPTHPSLSKQCLICPKPTTSQTHPPSLTPRPGTSPLGLCEQLLPTPHTAATAPLSPALRPGPAPGCLCFTCETPSLLAPPSKIRSPPFSASAQRRGASRRWPLLTAAPDPTKSTTLWTPCCSWLLQAVPPDALFPPPPRLPLSSGFQLIWPSDLSMAHFPCRNGHSASLSPIHSV